MSRVPVLVTSLGILILSCMDAMMKSVASSYPLAEMVGLRYLAGSTVCIIVCLSTGEALPRRAGLTRNVLRAVAVLFTAAAFFTAISRLPLVEAVSLTFLAPLFTAGLGHVLLKERVGARVGLGIAFGLLGVCIIGAGQSFDPNHALDVLGIGAALGCAFFYALSNVLVRRSAGADSALMTVTLANVIVSLLVFPPMAATWQAPSLAHGVVFGAAGLLGTAGHLCLAWSYVRAPAGHLGVLEYSAFIWTSILGLVFFGEVPSGFTMLGAGVIIAACIFSSWRTAHPDVQPITPPA
ncbi:MAG: DMT family transporter [Parafilimonas terrae]|nr:DMT family transporter [Parafilimonas terrae]